MNAENGLPRLLLRFTHTKAQHCHQNWSCKSVPDSVYRQLFSFEFSVTVAQQQCCDRYRG